MIPPPNLNFHKSVKNTDHDASYRVPSSMGESTVNAEPKLTSRFESPQHPFRATAATKRSGQGLEQQGAYKVPRVQDPATANTSATQRPLPSAFKGSSNGTDVDRHQMNKRVFGLSHNDHDKGTNAMQTAKQTQLPPPPLPHQPLRKQQQLQQQRQQQNHHKQQPDIYTSQQMSNKAHLSVHGQPFSRIGTRSFDQVDQVATSQHRQLPPDAESDIGDSDGQEVADTPTNVTHSRTKRDTDDKATKTLHPPSPMNSHHRDVRDATPLPYDRKDDTVIVEDPNLSTSVASQIWHLVHEQEAMTIKLSTLLAASEREVDRLSKQFDRQSKDNVFERQKMYELSEKAKQAMRDSDAIVESWVVNGANLSDRIWAALAEMEGVRQKAEERNRLIDDEHYGIEALQAQHRQNQKSLEMLRQHANAALAAERKAFELDTEVYRLKAVERELDTAHLQLVDCKSKVAQLEQQLIQVKTEKEAEVALLQTDKATAESKLERQTAAWKAAVQDVQTIKSQLDDHIRQQVSDANTTEESISSLTVDLNNARKEVREAKEDLVVSDIALQESKRKLKALESEKAKAIQERKVSEQRVVELSSELERTKHKLAEAEKEVEARAVQTSDMLANGLVIPVEGGVPNQEGESSAAAKKKSKSRRSRAKGLTPPPLESDEEMDGSGVLVAA